jgi:hypothetical protein
VRDGFAAGRFRIALAAAVTAVCLAAAGTASAHLRSGTVAVDYRVTVSHPITSAYSAQIYQSDHGLTLTVKVGHVVVMLGYLSEPVFRLDGTGLSVNAASPTARAMHLVTGAQAVDASTPHWRLQRGRHSVVWHDARVQGLPRGVDRGIWMVPLVIDGRPDQMFGVLRRYPAPPPWVWALALAAWLAVGAAPLLMRRRGRVRGEAKVLALVAALAATVVALGFALDAYASPGTWIEGLDVIAFLAVGVWVMRRGPQNLHVAAAIWIGLVSVAMGLLGGAVFLHPIVLAILPGVVMRLLVVTAIGAGTSAAVLGSTLFGEIAEAVREHDRRSSPGAASPP